MERMSTLDAEFYFAEHRNVPMHLGSVAVFDGPAPSREDLMRLYDAKLPLVPRYHQLARAVPFQLLRPGWVDDPEFSIRHHVRYVRAHAPGGQAELQAMAAKLFGVPLQRDRPLWEAWLVDGLADGRWAIVSKVHHCMTDGIGGNDLMAQIFDAAPGGCLPEASSWTPAPRPSLAAQAAQDLRDAVTSPLHRLAGLPAALRRAGTEDVLDYASGLGRSARLLAEPAADCLNGHIGPRRRWAWTTTDLAELKRIRAALGTSINDVVLAVITGAFRDLLDARRQLADGLVVRSLVPVSVRAPDEADRVTNRVSAVLANLPVGEPDPLRRLDLLHRQMDGLKQTHQAVSAEILTEVANLAAPMWLALGTRAAFSIPQPLVQTVTTNVPGPRIPLYVLGRRLTALHPYVPIGDSVRISVAILSYVNTVSFGVTADYDSAPDLDVFVAAIRHALADLATTAGWRSATG